MSTEDKLVVSGFGRTSANGEYYYSHDYNGKPLYKKGSSHLIAYATELGPYTFSPAYFLFEIVELQGAIPITLPIYLNRSDDPTTSGWESLLPEDSGENTTGTAELDYASSSSSSSTSESSSSSTSESSYSSSSSSSGPITRYVATDGNDANDGLTPATPKLTVQSAVDASDAGDIVQVAAGEYTVTTAIVVDKALTIRSASGKDSTTIKSDGVAGHRVIHLLADDSALEGFTVKDGVSPDVVGDGEGGNILMQNASSVSDCIVENGSGYQYGGNIMINNVGSGANVSRCIIRDGVTRLGTGGGGGVYMRQQDCYLDSCLVYDCLAPTGGGVASAASGSKVINCTITSNEASGWNVGVVLYGGGWVGQQQGSVKNSVIYGNNIQGGAANDACYIQYGSGAAFEYNDVGTEQVAFGAAPSGAGRISADPLFVNAGADNYRLDVGSPCENTGNSTLAIGATDLDGNPRVVGGQIDMGAYERQ